MKITSIFLVLIALSSCAPVFKKFYSYEPMQKESQRTCALSCQIIKQSCQTNQQQSYQLCRSNAKLDYQSCKSSEMWGYDSKGKWECQYNCYCYEESCSEPDIDLCEGQYASCYTGCGGKVNETTRCVANCEQLNAPQPQAAPAARSKSQEIY